MDEISIDITGLVVDQDPARLVAQQIAEGDNPETILLSRHNRERKAQSPCCLGYNLNGKPAWEVYGENHGGRVKIDVNGGEFVFVSS